VTHPKIRLMEAYVKTVDIIYRYEARDTSARPLPAESNAAVLRLNDGNRNFAALLDHVNNESGIQQIIPVDPRDLGFTPDAAETPKQRPFAAVLGCSDARVPIELIFNEGPNDLFIVRVAGGGLGLEVLGSLKYAVEQLGGTLKLIVVLGHSGCGALTMAVDVFLNPPMRCFRPTRSSKSSSATTCQICGQPTAFTFSKPAKYGRRAPATSMELDSRQLPAISRDLPVVATQWFNRNELLHISNSEHGLAEGMGLLIARTIIEAPHWQIWAENRDGAGASFRIRFPLVK